MIFKKIRKKIEILPKLKNVLIWVFATLALLYIGFLFVLPNVIKIENFSEQISNEVAKYSGFELDLKNPKLKTSYKLGIALKADKIALKYNKDDEFAEFFNPIVEINLPTLIFGKINLDKISSEKINLNLIFDKNKKYTIEDNVNKILSNIAQENSVATQNKQLPIKIGNINIEVDDINIKLKDENISKNFILSAKNTKLNLNLISNLLKLQTRGALFVENKKESINDFDIKLQAKLPTLQNATQSPTKQNDFKFNFNPLANLDTFNLHSKLLIDLKISNFENFSAKGYANLDGITFKINNLQLPKSHVKTEFNSHTLNIISKIFLTENEFLDVKSKTNLSKKKKINISAKTNNINLSSIKNLAQATLEMLNIESELKNTSLTGVLNCDFNIESDFKNVKSQGDLKLSQGNLKHAKLGLNLDKIQSLIDFSDNKITIKDTSANLNGANFNISGTIDTNSKLNISVNSDPINFKDIVNLAQQLHLVDPRSLDDITINGGKIQLLAKIHGDFKNINPNADIMANSISATIKSLKMPISLENLTLKLKTDDGKILGDFLAQNFSAKSQNPNLTTSFSKIQGNIDEKNIKITPFNLNIQNTITTISADIQNYLNSPLINIEAKGKLNPNTILTFIPKENRNLVKYNGQMPFGATITGKFDDLKITSNIISNPQNYISIAKITNLEGLTNTIDFSANLKNDLFLIENLSINSKGNKITTLEGKIEKIYSKNPIINKLNISIPQNLTILIPIANNLKFSTSGNLSLSGKVLSPQIEGVLTLSNLLYPDFKTTAQKIIIDFKKSIINAQAQGLKIAGSDFSGNATINPDFSKIIRINALNFNSNYIDTDTLLELMAKMPNTQTTAGPQLNAIIKTGKANIKKLKSGTLYPENITFDFNLYNNLFKLNNIIATFCDGKINASATYNLANTKVSADGTGKAINVSKAAKAFNLSSILMSGTLNGLAKVEFRGTTWEQQIGTLKGQVKFDITNGQYGESARFERFLQAGNLLTQSLLNFNLNQTISAVTSKNTGAFSKLEGTISLANSWANITNFSSTGSNMSLWASGKYNILTTVADIKVLGKISSNVANILGPLGNFSLDKAIDKLPTKGATIIKSIANTISPTKSLFEEISINDLNKIPALTNTQNNTNSKDFQVLIKGETTKVSSIKSFKWVQKQEQVSN